MCFPRFHVHKIKEGDGEMLYEKPQFIDAGIAEGVYMASGDNCDCFGFTISKQNRMSGFYSVSFNVIPLNDRTHMSSGYWNQSLTIEVIFNQTIPSNLTLIAGNAKVSGNTVVIYVGRVNPASNGDYATFNVQFSGTGAENLQVDSIVIHHN
jgi:hypothetical protein